MAGDEYSAVGGGGKLKLKGSKVKDGRVEKKKKRKEKGKEKDVSDDSRAKDDSTAKDDPARNEEGPEASRRHGDSADTGDQDDGKEGRVIYKTEAERKYEEQRKKRLDERLRREGVKTHKERVEELNRYLSTLSEHHDMPKIGPG